MLHEAYRAWTASEKNQWYVSPWPCSFGLSRELSLAKRWGYWKLLLSKSPRTELNWDSRDKNRTHKFAHFQRTQTKPNLTLLECELNRILSYVFGLHSGFVFGLGLVHLTLTALTLLTSLKNMGITIPGPMSIDLWTERMWLNSNPNPNPNPGLWCVVRKETSRLCLICTQGYSKWQCPKSDATTRASLSQSQFCIQIPVAPNNFCSNL